MKHLLILIAFAFLLGCIPVYSEVEPTNFHYDFFQQTMSEQAKKIHDYDLETQ